MLYFLFRGSFFWLIPFSLVWFRLSWAASPFRNLDSRKTPGRFSGAESDLANVSCLYWKWNWDHVWSNFPSNKFLIAWVGQCQRIDPSWCSVCSVPGLVEFLTQHSKRNFSAQLNAVLLAKCFRAKLWEDSPYISKQLDRIGKIIRLTL